MTGPFLARHVFQVLVAISSKIPFKKTLPRLFSIYSKNPFQNRVHRNHRIHIPFLITRIPLPDYAINVSNTQTKSMVIAGAYAF